MTIFIDSLFSSIAMGHFMVDVFNSSRPVLLTYLGLSESEIALFSTFYIWTSAMTQPFFGWLSDRVGPRWLAAGGVLWMTVFYSAALLIPGNAGLACLIIAALGSSAFHPVGTVQATLRGRDRLKGRETTAASFFFMSGQLGHFIGPVITGFILYSYNVPGLFIFPLVSLPIGFSLLYQLRDNHPHPKTTRAVSNRTKAGVTFIIVLAAVAMLQSWAQANMVNLIPKYLKDMGLEARTYGCG